jgi:uridine kinase
MSLSPKYKVYSRRDVYFSRPTLRGRKEDDVPVLKYNQKNIEFSSGQTLAAILAEPLQALDEQPVAAFVDKRLVSFNQPLFESATYAPVYLSSMVGGRVYEYTLYMLLARAVHEIFPKKTLHLRFSLNNGVYAEIEGLLPIGDANLQRLNKEIGHYCRSDVAINYSSQPGDVARKIIVDQHESNKEHLFSDPQAHYSLWELEGYYAFFPGPLLPSTRFLDCIELEAYEDGFLAKFPKRFTKPEQHPSENQRKIFAVHKQYHRWLQILNINHVGDVNRLIVDSGFSEFIKMCEAIQEKEISDIADRINQLRPTPRLILIAGPSSSGKTTFAKRLAIQLRVNGLRPASISLDNYYRDRRDAAAAKIDIESLDAIDYRLFNEHINALLAGQTVRVPIFSFHRQQRLAEGVNMQLAANGIIIVEGIHGLNPLLSEQIPSADKFRIYVSPLTQLPIDSSNRFSTSMNRLIRRIVRDHNFRGYQAENTLAMWASVRAGEERNIFPFQENADALFNTALMYELNILQPLIMPLLKEITARQEEYTEARHLHDILSFYHPYTSDEIPPTSLLREFIGNSSFSYKH